MALGQAAGLAAALCIEAGLAVEDVDIDQLQQRLLEQGAVLVYEHRPWQKGVGDVERRTIQWDRLRMAKQSDKTVSNGVGDRL